MYRPGHPRQRSFLPGERGVGLLELLVGLGIGLLVALAALGSLMTSRLASNAVGDSTRMQQDASTALRILGHQLRQAGAQSLQDTQGGQVRWAQTGLSNDPNLALSGQDGGPQSSDTLEITHDTGAAVDARDCLGQTPAGPVNRSSFRVRGHELQCRGSAARPTYQGLISGVEDFQVWYGMHTGSTLQYLAASAVTQWPEVKSLQVCLRLVGEIGSYPVGVPKLRGCSGETVSLNDGRIRRVYRHVFNLRNITP